MYCPFCKADDTKVVDSRLVADGGQDEVDVLIGRCRKNRRRRDQRNRNRASEIVEVRLDRRDNFLRRSLAFAPAFKQAGAHAQPGTREADDRDVSFHLGHVLLKNLRAAHGVLGHVVKVCPVRSFIDDEEQILIFSG